MKANNQTMEQKCFALHPNSPEEYTRLFNLCSVNSNIKIDSYEITGRSNDNGEICVTCEEQALKALQTSCLFEYYEI